MQYRGLFRTDMDQFRPKKTDVDQCGLLRTNTEQYGIALNSEVIGCCNFQKCSL